MPRGQSLMSSSGGDETRTRMEGVQEATPIARKTISSKSTPNDDASEASTNEAAISEIATPSPNEDLTHSTAGLYSYKSPGGAKSPALLSPTSRSPALRPEAADRLPGDELSLGGSGSGAVRTRACIKGGIEGRGSRLPGPPALVAISEAGTPAAKSTPSMSPSDTDIVPSSSSAPQAHTACASTVAWLDSPQHSSSCSTLSDSHSSAAATEKPRAGALLGAAGVAGVAGATLSSARALAADAVNEESLTVCEADKVAARLHHNLGLVEHAQPASSGALQHEAHAGGAHQQPSGPSPGIHGGGGVGGAMLAPAPVVKRKPAAQGSDDVLARAAKARAANAAANAHALPRAGNARQGALAVAADRAVSVKGSCHGGAADQRRGKLEFERDDLDLAVRS